MALPLYLAQSPSETAGNPLPGRYAYMACRFSPGGAGLCSLPESLPPGAIVILDDSAPMNGHDPQWILAQLSGLVARYSCEALLLDFQRPAVPGQQALAELLCTSLPCPVAVSEFYARELSCPVFLSPVPPDRPPGEHLALWRDREIWLDAALEGIQLTLTEAGCAAEPLWDFPENGLTDEKLHCHYTIETRAVSATFRLWRTRSDLESLLAEAGTRNVRKAIGLWQELRG